MADDAAGAAAGSEGDGGGSSTGLLDTGGGGEPTGAVDLAAVAAEFEAEVTGVGGDAGQTGTGEGSDGQGEGAGAGKSASTSTDPLDEFIQREYQGNRAAFTASLYESRQESKRLATEVEILKRERAATPRDIEGEWKAARSSDPDVQALDQEIQAIREYNQAVPARQAHLGLTAQTLQTKITELESQLPHVAEEPKELAKTQSALIRARAELSEISAEFRSNQTQVQNNQRDERRLSRELARAEQTIRDQMADHESRQSSEAASNQRTLNQFASAFETHIEKYGLDPKSERFTYARESTRTLLADFLQYQAGPDEPMLDAAGIYDAVGKLVTAYARSHGLQPRSGAKPNGRVPAQTPARTAAAARQVLQPRGSAAASTPAPAPNGSPARPRNTDEVLSNPELVRRRAEAIFSAASQSRGLRGRGLG